MLAHEHQHIHSLYAHTLRSTYISIISVLQKTRRPAHCPQHLVARLLRYHLTNGGKQLYASHAGDLGQWRYCLQVRCSCVYRGWVGLCMWFTCMWYRQLSTKQTDNFIPNLILQFSFFFMCKTWTCFRFHVDRDFSSEWTKALRESSSFFVQKGNIAAPRVASRPINTLGSEGRSNSRASLGRQSSMHGKMHVL